MSHLVKNLFFQVLEQTEAILSILRQGDSKQKEVEKQIEFLISEREELVKQLCEYLMQESATPYQKLYQQLKQKEEELIQEITARMSQLKLQLQDAQQSRSIRSQYDSYFRLMPFGAFLDEKK